MKKRSIVFIAVVLAMGAAAAALGGSYANLNFIAFSRHAETLPDGVVGAAPGVGWTCTGLAHDPHGGWWIGNDGRAAEGAPFRSSIVHVSEDFTRVLGNFPTIAMGLAPASVQGVAYDPTDDTIWFISKDDAPSARAVHMSRAGSVLAVFPLAARRSNGLAYDSRRDQLIIGEDGGGIVWFDKASLRPAMSARALSQRGDQLFYDAARDRLLVSYGHNGGHGRVAIWALSPSPRLLQTKILFGADAIEGVAQKDGQWLVLNDAGFHRGNPALNRVMSYGG